MVVAPSPAANPSPSGDDLGWTEVRSRKGGRAGSDPAVRPRPSSERRSDRHRDFNARSGRDVFLSRFKGKCFRCLSELHRRKDCRDPLRCILCKRQGHFAWECPQNPKNGGPGGTARERLKPAPSRAPVRDRLRFPSPARPSPPSPAMDRFLHCDPARRPRVTNKVVVASPVLEREEFVLRQHAVTLSAVDGIHATNPMAVGKAIEELIGTPPFQLRVTSHLPEAFLVHFDLPAHRDDAARRGSIKVDGFKFFICAWHENDHAAIMSLPLHVRIVVEGLPMQFWSLDGADEAFGDFGRIDRLDRRTLERGHTKTFACWLWTWSVAHIPTTRALWVLKRGAGRVDEIIGYSPPDRRVPPPPGVRRYDMLIHMDRMEDWTPLSPRPSHSGQSGIPSSSDDDDDRPFPRTEPGSWVAGVEDGQAPGRRAASRAPASGCRGGPPVADRRDTDRDGNQGGLRRSWKDAFLGNSCHAKGKATDVVEAAPRYRNKAPSDHRHDGQGKQAKEGSVLKATPRSHSVHARPLA